LVQDCVQQSSVDFNATFRAAVVVNETKVSKFVRVFRTRAQAASAGQLSLLRRYLTANNKPNDAPPIPAAVGRAASKRICFAGYNGKSPGREGAKTRAPIQ
jgi:hypothetical protein